MTAASGIETELVRPVAGLLRATIDVAVARGRGDLAGDLEAELAPHPVGEVLLPVVGESGRGKSRFVNALLGENVCPVGLETPPPVYVVLEHGPERGARAFGAGARDGRAVSVDGLADTIAADPDIARIEVTLPHPLLEQGLVIADCPGVGGLESAHGDVTLAVLSRADALVFVVDSGAPLSRRELGFLERATERIGAVLFVQTKVDAHVGWQEIIVENRALLAHHVPALAGGPFFAVSSLEKEDADRLADPELAAESGLPAVERALVGGVLARRSRLRLLNSLQSERLVLHRLDEPERAVCDAPSGPDSAERWIAAGRTALAAHAESTSGWHARFSLEFGKVQNRVYKETQRRFAELARSYETRVASETVDEDMLKRDLELAFAALATDLDTLLINSLEQLVGELMETFGVDPEGATFGSADRMPPIQIPDAMPSLSDPTQRYRNLSVLMGPTAVGRLLAPALGGSVVLGAGLGLGVGALILGVIERKRLGMQSRVDGRAIVHAALEAARIEIDAHIRDRVLDVQYRGQTMLEHAIERRRAELQTVLDHEVALQRATEDERRAVVERAQARMVETQPLWDMAAELTRRLTEARDAVR